MPLRGSVDADVSVWLASNRMGHHGGQAGEVAHDEGHQVGGHGRRGLEVCAGPALLMVVGGPHRHVGEGCYTCSGFQGDAEVGLHCRQFGLVRQEQVLRVSWQSVQLMRSDVHSSGLLFPAGSGCFVDMRGQSLAPGCGA